MGTEIQWVPWNPQVGDMYPESYQYAWKRTGESPWIDGKWNLDVVDELDLSQRIYRIPAPPLDIDLPYLLKKSAACSPSTQAAVLALKATFADEVGKLIEADTKGGE